MDWDDAPGTLDAELFEKRSCDDSMRRSERVRVKEGGPDDANENNRESAAEDLRRVSDNGTSGHGTKICYDLRDCYSVGAEVVLIGQHGWI